MRCPKCHHTAITLDIIDEATVTIHCVMGHSITLHKYRKTWETGEQRMKRMERHFTCSVCENDCVTYKDNHEGNERTLCDACRAREYKPDYVPMGRRKNIGSPWRIWENKAPKEEACSTD